MADNKASVLVTGATGNTGFATVKELVSRFPDLKISAGVHNPAKADKLAPFKEKGLQLVEFDSSKMNTMQNVMKGVDRVFIIPPPLEARSQFVRQVTDACKQGNVKFICLLSTLVANNPKLVFGQQWNEAERYIKESDISFTFLRFPMFHDNNFANAESVKSKGVFYAPLGPDKPIVTIAVQDVGRVAAEVLAHPERHSNKIYNLTAPPYTYGKELTEAFSKVAGKTVNYQQASWEDAFKSLVLKGIPEWQAIGSVELYRDAHEGGINSRHTNDFEQITGQKPMPISEWVEAHAEAFRGAPAR
jgi:uncharacterized protein YbjT (DUF2867 family)